MKIATLNIRHGGGAKGSDRPDRLAAFLTSSDVDVFVLTEARRSYGTEVILSRLGEAGWSHQVSNHLIPRKNSVALASRLPAEAVDMSMPDDIESRRFVEALVGDIHVTGAYFPLKMDKAPYFREAKRLLDRGASEGDAHVLLGDFNTGDDVDTEGMAFFCGEDFRALSDTGYIDAWRTRHPAGREFSWYSNAGNGFRIDHAFLSPALSPRLAEAHYDHTPREEHFTDHSMLTVHLRG